MAAHWIFYPIILSLCAYGALYVRVVEPTWRSRLVALPAVLGAASALLWLAAAAWGGSPPVAQLEAPGPLPPILSGLGLRLDVLSGAVFLAVSILGFAVARLSVTALRGDEHQDRFLRDLSLTLCAIQTFVLSGHLGLSLVAWLTMSLGVHRLLRHYDGRERARLAARKKFLFARLGDVCLVTALALVFDSTGTLSIGELSAMAADSRAETNSQLGWAAFGFAGAAIFKSAQFPFHAWLPETMEAPTPVSMLMHAGVINAGAYLLLRLAPLVGEATGALDLLMLVGGTTALFALVVQDTQPERKTALAWSTVGQMGFVLFEIGLGLPGAALLHLLGHAVYKAHAFLRAGTLARPRRQAAPSRRSYLLGAVAASAILTGFAFVADEQHRSELLLAGVLALGVAHALPATAGRGFIARAVAVLGCSAISFALLFFGEGLLSEWLAPLPGLDARGGLSLALGAFVVAALLAWSLWSVGARREDGWQFDLYVHARNGFYFGPLTDRLTNLVFPERTLSRWLSPSPSSKRAPGRAEPQLELGTQS